MAHEGHRGGTASVLLAASLWGTWSLFLRPTGLSSWTTGALVLAFTAPIALTLARLERGVAPRWDRTTLALLAALAVSDAVNVGTFFAAMDRTSIAIAVLTHSFAPVLVALAAPLVDRQTVPFARAAAFVAVGGIALVLEPWRTRSDELGAALGLASAVGYACNVFLTRRLTVRIGALRTMGWHALGSALLLFPLAVGELGEVELFDLVLLAAAAALLGMGGNVAFAAGLVRIGSARASVLALLEPLVACAVGWAVFDQALSGGALAGALLVVGAGAAVARSPRSAVRGKTPA